MPTVWTILTAFSVTACVTAGLIRAATISRLIVRPSESRCHSAPTPTAGGLAIITGLGISVLAFSHVTDRAGSMPALVVTGVVGAAALGLLDDVAVLRP